MADIEDDEQDDGDNGAPECTDEVKRDLYRRALLLKIAHEASVDTAKGKLGEYRSHMKAVKKKAGAAYAKAVQKVLSERFEDAEVLVLELREQMKVLDLSGVVPKIIDKILDRLNIEEPTANETHQMALDRAYDDGVFTARESGDRESNPHAAGSDEFYAWDRGFLWLQGQQKIAEEMDPAKPPPAAPLPRDRGGRKRNPVTVPGNGTTHMDGDQPGPVH